MNVEIPAGRAQIRVSEELADVADRNAGLVEAGAGFVPQIAQLKPLQAGCSRGTIPRGSQGLYATANLVTKHIGVGGKRVSVGCLRRSTILPCSLHLPVAATEGSPTENSNKIGVRLWTDCSLIESRTAPQRRDRKKRTSALKSHWPLTT